MRSLLNSFVGELAKLMVDSFVLSSLGQFVSSFVSSFVRPFVAYLPTCPLVLIVSGWNRSFVGSLDSLFVG